MWFDFSPMRIDEYLRQDSQLWTETLVCRSAASEARDRARDEGTAITEAQRMSS